MRRLVLAMRWDVSGRTTATHPVILLPGQTGLTSQVAAPSYADSTGRTDMPRSGWVRRAPMRADARQVLGRSCPHRSPGATYGGRGNVQEIAAFTSSATLFSTVGLHFWSAYDAGHMSPWAGGTHLRSGRGGAGGSAGGGAHDGVP